MNSNLNSTIFISGFDSSPSQSATDTAQKVKKIVSKLIEESFGESIDVVSMRDMGILRLDGLTEIPVRSPLLPYASVLVPMHVFVEAVHKIGQR